MFCYIHEGGQLVKCVGGSVQYQGSRSESMVVSRHMSHSDFVSKLCDALHFDRILSNWNSRSSLSHHVYYHYMTMQPYLRCFDSTKCFVTSMSHHQVKLLKAV